MVQEKGIYYFTHFLKEICQNQPFSLFKHACKHELCSGQILNAHSLIKNTCSYFLKHLCFYWTLARINNHITEKDI